MILKHKKTQILCLFIFLFFFSLIILFNLRNNIKNLNKELYSIKGEITRVENLLKILQTDFTNLSKLNRISKIAEDKLGLKRTNSYQVKKLSDFRIN
tara:strand:- start:6741 stop:7031 length:291 start_codon:yes stop_codon:yes gene_type:complete